MLLDVVLMSMQRRLNVICRLVSISKKELVNSFLNSGIDEDIVPMQHTMSERRYKDAVFKVLTPYQHPYNVVLTSCAGRVYINN